MTDPKEGDGRPKRIQRKRTKGWRMPEGAVYVGRPSSLGNPYTVGEVCHVDHTISTYAAHPRGLVLDVNDVMTHYRTAADAVMEFNPTEITRLRGRDLACWCPLDQPCHADVLLELANR